MGISIKLPNVDMTGKETADDKIAYLVDLIQSLKKNLEYHLNNIDSDQILNIDSAIITNLQSVNIEAQHILITEGGTARVVFDSTTIAMQVWEDGAWVNKVYFDSVTGKYIFDGDLSATTITTIESTMESLITMVFYADKGEIAELTVDSLKTHDKIQKRLNNDQSDVKWIWIEDQYIKLVSSEDCLGTTEYIYNRSNEQLFWVDETHTHVTTEATDYPIEQFLYDKELVKLSLAFESDGVNQVPMIVLGAGTGITGDKDGRGFIYKDDGGLYIEYHTYGQAGVPNDGDVFRLGLSEAGIDFSQFTGITFNPTTILTGLVQIWVQDDTPVGAKEKDVWIDTNDYSRYDIMELATGYTLVESDAEIIRVTLTEPSTLTLHAHTSVGIIKKVYNVGTVLLTIIPATGGYMNGVLNGSQLLYPYESAEFITNGTGWNML